MTRRRNFIFTSFLLLILACWIITPYAEANDLSKKTIIMVIPPENFRDEELKIPKDILQGQGATIITASTHKKPITGMMGTRLSADKTLKELKAQKFDAIIFIGGAGAKRLFNNTEAHDLALRAVKENRILGAICLAPVILARAGILKDKRATVYTSAKKELTNNGAIYTGSDIETDGKIVTASGPKAAFKFAYAISSLLNTP